LKRLIAVAVALFCGAAGAAPSADPYFGLIIGEDWAELDRLAHERLAADPLDGLALHALGRLSIDSKAGSEEMRAALMPQIEACVSARPMDAMCRLAYGQVLGAQLSKRGMFDALGSVNKVSEAFEASVATDPANYDARESLVTFYLRAPGIVGGSMRRAYKNAADYAKISPDYARLLYALIALEDNDLSKAEAQLSALPDTSFDPVLAHMVAKRWLAIGLAHADVREYDLARAALVRSRDNGAPSVAANAHLGLGRIAQAEGRSSDAIEEFQAVLAFATPSSKPAEEARASLKQLSN
jgi:tetratricopeptide (TPR) repeat protein